MKRIFLIVIFLGAFCGLCSAQMMADSTVQVVAYWALGDKYNYQVEEQKGVISGTDTTIVEKSAEIITLEVVDETDSTYTLRVSYDDYQHSDYALMAANDAVEKLFGKTWFNVVTDTYGSFLRVEMPDTYTQAGQAMISETINSVVSEKGLPEEGKQMVTAVVESMISPESFTTAAIGEIAPLLFFHGARFSLPDEYEYEEDMMTVFGDGNIIKANGRLWVDEDLTDEVSVVMRIYREADQDSIRPYLVNLFASILQAAAPEMTEMDKDEMDEIYELFDIDLADYVVEEIHLDTGWPIYYQQTRYVDVWQGEELLSEQYTNKTVELMD